MEEQISQGKGPDIGCPVGGATVRFFHDFLFNLVAVGSPDNLESA